MAPPLAACVRRHLLPQTDTGGKQFKQTPKSSYTRDSSIGRQSSKIKISGIFNVTNCLALALLLISS